LNPTFSSIGLWPIFGGDQPNREKVLAPANLFLHGLTTTETRRNQNIMSRPSIGEPYSEVKPFPEMLSVVTDPNLEVFQITTDLEQSGNGRGAFFTPDSGRFIFKRSRSDSQEAYWAMCDLEDGFTLRNLTDPAENPTAAFLSGDGAHLYYFQDSSHEENPRIVLKRISLDSFVTEEVTVFDQIVEGIGRRPRAGGDPVRGMTQGSSLRSDSKAVCTGFNFVGDDNEDHFAPVIINLETLGIHGFTWEPYSWRVGGTYFRGDAQEHQNHLFFIKSWRSQRWADGKYFEKLYSDIAQASMHVISEQGEILATVPIGGEGQGVDHPMWRGGLYEVVVHSGDFISSPHWRGTIRTARPVPCDPEHYQKGREIPGGDSVDLTRKFTRPDVCHQSWHVDGIHGVFDTEGWHGRGTPCLQGPSAFLYLGTVVEGEDGDPQILTRYLVHPRSSWSWAWTENCPELSPDLKTVIFNSDWTCKLGVPQVFLARGFGFP